MSCQKIFYQAFKQRSLITWTFSTTSADSFHQGKMGNKKMFIIWKKTNTSMWCEEATPGPAWDCSYQPADIGFELFIPPILFSHDFWLMLLNWAPCGRLWSPVHSTLLLILVSLSSYLLDDNTFVLFLFSTLIFTISIPWLILLIKAYFIQIFLFVKSSFTSSP